MLLRSRKTNSNTEQNDSNGTRKPPPLDGDTYFAKYKINTILFATECQYERRSIDTCHFDLETFLRNLKKENGNISIQVRHKTQEDIQLFCIDKK